MKLTFLGSGLVAVVGGVGFLVFSLSNSLMVALFVWGVGVAFSFFIFHLFWELPLNQMKLFFKEMEEGVRTKGEFLRHTFEVERAPKELHDLVNSLNTIFTSYQNLQAKKAHHEKILQELVEEMGRKSLQLSSATGHMRLGIEQMSEEADQQIRKIQSVQSNLELMSEGITQVNQNNWEAEKVATEVIQKARHGGESVSDTIQSIDGIAQSVDHTNKKLHQLKDRASEIENIIVIIDDITESTDLLSLNTAIEAGRAGAKGRGFTVIADEVHAIAEKSTQSAQKITQLIRNIQQDIQEVVQLMNKATEQVVHGKELSYHSGKSLLDILKVAKKLKEQVDAISTAINAQSSSSRDINLKMEEIYKITHQGANLSNQLLKEMNSLPHYY